MWAGKFLETPFGGIDYDDVVVSGLYEVGTIAIMCLKSTRYHLHGAIFPKARVLVHLNNTEVLHLQDLGQGARDQRPRPMLPI
jgi:hypothetical protein